MSLLPGARSRVIHIVVVTASLWPWSNYQSTEQEISDEKMDRECWRQDGTLECYSGQAMTSNVAQAFFTLGHIRWNLQEMETLQRKWGKFGQCTLSQDISHVTSDLLLRSFTNFPASDWSRDLNTVLWLVNIELIFLLHLLGSALTISCFTRPVQIPVSRNRKLFLLQGIIEASEMVTWSHGHQGNQAKHYQTLTHSDNSELPLAWRGTNTTLMKLLRLNWQREIHLSFEIH